MKEARAVLASVFGDEWEMFLMAEGVVGGSDDSDVLADRDRVLDLARRKRPDLDDEWYAAAADAWFQLWVR